jgi:hypothetical protein
MTSSCKYSTSIISKYYTNYCQPLLQALLNTFISDVFSIFTSSKKKELIQYFLYLIIVVFSYFAIFNGFFSVLYKEVEILKNISTLIPLEAMETNEQFKDAIKKATNIK